MKDNSKKDKNLADTTKRIPVWKLVVIDTTALAVSMGVFLMFDYIIPKSAGTSGQTITDVSGSELSDFDIPSEENKLSGTGKNKPKKEGEKIGREKGGKNTGNTNTTSISSDSNSSLAISSSDISSTLLEKYSDDNVKITINEKSIGSDSEKITYYTADIYVTNVRYFKTAFAESEYGKNIKDTIDNIAEENNAILAVNGDFYGNGEDGIVIRNGVLYRSNINDADICVLFTDGTMKTYSPQDFNCDNVISTGAWQAWTFGPALLDGTGNVLSSFNTTSYLNSENPRTAIGYVSPGHYVFVVVDGRSEGHSKGATLSELAQIMAHEGCISAYNLDGGKSSGMVFKGSYINEPVSGGREVSDIVYIGS